MQELLVTTSWDDGHKLDERLAALLKKYGIKATFYISPRDHEFPRSELLSDAAIKKISRSFEIGAHTMTHPRLRYVSDKVARKEIIDSKLYLEKLTGKPVTSFCYPGGSYQKRHVAMVREAGFAYARTVWRHEYGFGGAPFTAKTTINTYNHYQDLWKIARFVKFNPLKTLHYFKWDNLAKAQFDRMLKSGGVFHLWGHSWEVDQHGEWEKLEAVLSHISNNKSVRYVTNGELMSLKPKRLLLAAPYFPPHLGGAEFYCYSVARSLKRQYGWDVSVATSGTPGFMGSKLASYKGVKIHKLPYWLKVSNTPINPMWYFTIKRICKKENINIVNAHAPVPFLADVTVRAIKKLPVVVTYHHHMSTADKGRPIVDQAVRFYEEKLLPRTLRLAGKVICNSDLMRDEFLAAFRDKSVTITPGVDTNFFTPPAKRTTADSLLFVGSLEASNSYKGLQFLLDAFVGVIEKHPKATLTVIGEGDGEKGYKTQARKLGIANSVQFVGGKYGKDLVRHFQDSRVFVLPSLSESFGMVAVEAMACGLPVVGTKVGGIPQVVQDNRTGFLVPAANSSALADKINYLLDNPEIALQFGKNARKRVEERFSWDTRAEQTNDLLTGCIHSGIGASDNA